MTDYELDSLSNAINMAFRLGDLQFYRAPSMQNHPGVPFYLLSWLGLALAGYPIATQDALQFFRGLLDHVERFHFIMIGLATLAGASGIFLFARQSQKIVPTAVTAIALLIWIGSTPISLFSFLSLSIDSLGPLLFAVFLWCSGVWLTKPGSRQQPSSWPAASPGTRDTRHCRA